MSSSSRPRIGSSHHGRRVSHGLRSAVSARRRVPHVLLVLIVCVMAAGCAAPRDAALEPVLEPELTAAVEPALEPSPYIEMVEEQPRLRGQSGGVITGSRGEPVVGAQIRLWVDADGDGAIGPGDSIWAITESTGAGADEAPGSYVFTDLGPGCYITEYVNPRTLVTTVKAWCSPEAATAPWSVTVDFGG